MREMKTVDEPKNSLRETSKQRSRARVKRLPFPGQDFKKTPQVSVVIPCYNYGHYLPAAVESVLRQETVDVRVIIVDDSSTDDSLAIAEALAVKDNRIRVFARHVNGGPVATFNEGLAAVEGKYIVRLDADDLLTPGSLLRSVAVAETYPGVGLVYGHPLHFEGNQLPAPRSKTSKITIWSDRQWLEDICTSGRNVITSPEVLMRTSVIRRVGGQADLAHTHDMEHWLRIAAFSDVAYLHGVDQAWHREHAQSLSSREVTGPVDLEQRLLAFQTLFEVWGSEIDPSGSMKLLANKSIARQATEAAIHALDAKLPWDEAFAPFRVLVEKSGETLPASLAAAQPGDARSAWMSLRGQWRRLKRGIRHRYSKRRWHRRGVY